MPTPNTTPARPQRARLRSQQNERSSNRARLPARGATFLNIQVQNLKTTFHQTTGERPKVLKIRKLPQYIRPHDLIELFADLRRIHRREIPQMHVGSVVQALTQRVNHRLAEGLHDE